MKNLNSTLLQATVYLLLVLPIFIYSCTGSKQSAGINNDFPGEDSDSLVASIERTRCFGVCPVYLTKIYRSGYVLYEGYDHVPNVGKYYTWLTPQQLTGIGLKAEALGYFDLPDEVRNPHLTDFPTIKTEVRFRGKRKKNTCYHSNPPANLVAMQEYLDGLFSAETPWIKHPVQDLKD
jgi:hypothetical protein